MKKLMLLFAIMPILIFASCEKVNESGAEVITDKLTGTVWQKIDFNYDQKLEFIESNKIKYSLYSITNGVKTLNGTPTIMSYSISNGIPLVDNEAVLAISSSSDYYDGYKIYIYKDFLLWETKSPYDSSTSKNTFKKIQ